MAGDLAALPKAELHIHLEGAIRPATLEEFAAREGVTIPRTFDNLNTFIECFAIAWQTMSSPCDYARMMSEYCEDAARAGVRYAEVALMTIARPFDPRAAVIEAASRQQADVLRLIAAIPRLFPLSCPWCAL